MPIDPSISLQVKPVQIESPLNALAKVMQVQGLQRQNELGGIQLQQARETADRQNKLRQLMSGFTPDMSPEQQVGKLTQGGYLTEARSLAESASKVSKEKREAEKAQLEGLLSKINIGSQILGSVTDEQSYQRGRQIAAQAGFDPWPEQFDPGWVQQQAQMGLTLKDKAEAAWKARTDETARRGQDIGAATTRRGQDISAGTAAQRLAFDKENAGQGVTYQTDESGNIVALPTKLPPGAPATGRVAVGPDGKPIVSGGKPLTDAQSKAALFGTRMQEANKIFDSLEQSGTTTSIPGSRAGFGVGATINAFSPASQQKLDQAKRDFVNAVLRRESGAVISDAEFANAEKQYFPQIGDASEVIAQKKQNREVAQRGVMAEVPQGKRSSIAAEITGKSVAPKITNDAEYNALPSGATFIDPNGKTRRKP